MVILRMKSSVLVFLTQSLVVTAQRECKLKFSSLPIFICLFSVLQASAPGTETEAGQG